MAGEDEAYLSWIRRQPCAMSNHARRPHGRSEAHHATHGRGLGQRTHDHTAVPLCSLCHAAFHDGREPFLMMTRWEREVWMDEMAAKHRAAYERWMANASF